MTPNRLGMQAPTFINIVALMNGDEFRGGDGVRERYLRLRRTGFVQDAGPLCSMIYPYCRKKASFPSSNNWIIVVDWLVMIGVPFP